MKRAAQQKNPLSMTWLVARESFRSFGLNQDLQAAAGLACYGFLSLMPLLLLLFFICGIFMRSSDAVLASVQELTRDLFPAFNETILEDLLALSQRRVWGLVSVIALLWSMTPFAAGLRLALRRIFKSERKLSFVILKSLDLSAVLALLLLFVFVVGTRVYFAAAGSVPFVGRLFNAVAPFTMTVLTVCFFYFVFAPTRVRAAELLAGAVTAAILLSVMRPLFALVLAYNPSYGYAFGSLKAIFILIIWVYYTFAVLLLGAEVMANVRRRETLLLRGLFEGGGGPAAGGMMERFLRRLEPGETLFREGDDGHEMYYVVGGEVVLSISGKPIRTMRPGDYFGEMSMLLNAPRSATAAASSEAELLAISESNFDTLLRENPRIVQSILKEMAVRLRSMNEARGDQPP